jgi:hypothetical protein
MTDIAEIAKHVKELLENEKNDAQNASQIQRKFACKLPWNKQNKRGADLARDARQGYPLPDVASELIENGRGNNELRQKALRRLARTYPLVNVGALTEKSALDAQFADQQKTAKFTVTASSLIAQRDKQQNANDLQCRMLIPALTVLAKLQEQLRVVPIDDDASRSLLTDASSNSEFGSTASDDLSARDGSRRNNFEPIASNDVGDIFDTLGVVETMLRDALATNRHAAHVIEHQTRDQFAVALDFPAGARAELARNPSSDPKRLFGNNIVELVDKERRASEQTTLLKLATQQRGGSKPQTTYTSCPQSIATRPRGNTSFGQRRGFRGNTNRDRNFSGARDATSTRSGPPASVPRASSI